MANTYCDIAPGLEWHGPYHEREYGFPLPEDSALFERLVLEINQAGLRVTPAPKSRSFKHLPPVSISRGVVRRTNRAGIRLSTPSEVTR